MHLLSKDLFTKQKYSQECRFKEEGERTLHRQCLGDDLTCVRRESGPVRAKFKLHRYARHHTSPLFPYTTAFDSALAIPASSPSNRFISSGSGTSSATRCG